MQDRSTKNGDGLLALDHLSLPRAISELALSTIEWQDTEATFASRILIRDGFNWLKSIPENELNPTVFHGSSRLFLDSIE